MYASSPPGSLSLPHFTLIHACHVTDSLVAAPVHALCARERVASTRLTRHRQGQGGFLTETSQKRAGG